MWVEGWGKQGGLERWGRWRVRHGWQVCASSRGILGEGGGGGKGRGRGGDLELWERWRVGHGGHLYSIVSREGRERV